MKLVFRKEQLMNAVNIVLKAVPSKTTMTILQCILIDAQSDTIRLTGNDTELGIETKAEGEIQAHGKIALEAKLFSEIIRKLSGEDDIILETDEKLSTTIKSGKALFRIQGRDPEEFSYIPHIGRDHYICISEYTLKDIIRQTIFSISPNDSNRMMTGEYLKVEGSRLSLVALDGHRMSIRNVALKNALSDVSAIIPGKSLSEISRILGDNIESDVLIFFDEGHAMFEFGDTVIVTRLIDGEYFRVNQMISRDYATKVVINRQQFLSEIDKASIFIRENDKRPVVFQIRDTELQVRLKSTFGSLNSEIPAQKTGNDLMIGFNPAFFMDALRNIDDEEVTLYMMNPKSPCFIRDENESYIYLILPVNFNPEDI